MNSYEARLKSFSKTKKIKKSTSKQNSPAASVKWPHPASYAANPTSLAEAGFFFDPSWEDRDSVTCFMCSKELSAWDKDDDPVDIHFAKCGTTCPWAMVSCGLRHDMGEDGQFYFGDATRLPSSKAMEKARLATFTSQDSWPHDATKGHGASSKKLAQAGFVYTPTKADDDTASCLYCNTTLSGWEIDDDPVEEHRKRAEKSAQACPFFSSPTDATSSRPASRTGSRAGSRAPSRSKSKPPSPSRNTAVATSPDSDDEFELLVPVDRPLRATKPPSVDGAKTPRAARSKSRSRRTTRVPSESGKSTADAGDSAGDEKTPAKTPKTIRKGRGKSKGRATIATELNEEDRVVEKENDARRVAESSADVVMGDELSPPPDSRSVKAKRIRRVTKAPEAPPASDGEDGGDVEMQDGADVRPVKAKKTRRVTKAPDAPPAQASNGVAVDVQLNSKPKRGRRATKAPAPEQADIDDADVEAKVAEKPKRGRPAKVGPAPAQEAQPVDDDIDQVDELLQAEPELNDSSSPRPTKPLPASKASKAKKKVAGSRSVSRQPSVTDVSIAKPRAAPRHSPDSPPLPTERTSGSDRETKSRARPLDQTNSKTKIRSPGPPSPSPPQDSQPHSFLTESAPAQNGPALNAMNLLSLSDHDRNMTVEQWIRREIHVHYHDMQVDGNAKIDLFKEKAQVIRRHLESL